MGGILQLGSPQKIAIEMLKGIKVHRILDVGCGNGKVAHEILKQKLGEKVYGIDLDETLLSQAKKEGVITHKLDLNFEKFPFSDEYFDIVISIDVIEHILNLNHFLSEINRVLKKDGILVLSTPNIQFIYYIIKLILGYGPKTSFGKGKYYGAELYDGGHIHYFTLKDLIKLLNYNHFIVLDVRGTYNVSKTYLKTIMK